LNQFNGERIPASLPAEGFLVVQVVSSFRITHIRDLFHYIRRSTYNPLFLKLGAYLSTQIIQLDNSIVFNCLSGPPGKVLQAYSITSGSF
jgi:hypothetical protein